LGLYLRQLESTADAWAYGSRDFYASLPVCLRLHLVHLPRKLWADNWRDELWMLLLGVTGGSLYFVTENEAVKIDYVNNVSFIVCTAPLLTTLLALAFVRSVKATRPLILGSIAATLGVALVVF
jgi:drug/metabolite transporter (DMT)-like permease